MLLIAVALASSLSAVAAPLPDLALSWKKGQGVLTVVEPPGEHVAPEAPVRGFVEQGEARTEWALPGSLLVEGLRLPIGPGRLSGQLRVSLCEDDGSTCRWAEVVVAGEVIGKRGQLLLDGREPPVAPPPPAPLDPAHIYVGDPDAAMLDAQARAAATDGRVLLDFGAVWCPPCNLMSSEVLHDPADAAALEGLVLVAVDADRPDSWTLKDRYAVGGYPTLVATDAQGREVARLVGYPGQGPLLDWLLAVREGLDLQHLADAEPTPQVALGVAYAFARQGQPDDARRALEIALHDPALADRPELRRTRFLLDQRPDDLHWLLANDTAAPGPVLEWIWDAMDLAKQDPATADALRDGLARVLPRSSPAEQADLLWVLAELEPEGARRRALKGAAASALQGALTGDLHQDRGYLSFQADLLAAAGDVDGAVRILAEAARTWPDDFTFHYALASTLHEAGRQAQAEQPARAALAHAYGDNRLRAARCLSEVLAALDQKDEALAVIAEALATAERPAEGVDVRTPRYVKALEELRAELGG